MGDAARLSLESWKEARDDARKVELEIAECWDRYFERLGPPPGEELIHRASELRAVANHRLEVVLVATGSVKARPPSS
jgi:hypothetical protein